MCTTGMFFAYNGEKLMEEAASNLGFWLVSEEANLFQRESLNVYIVGARSVREISDILAPLAKRLKNGLVAFSPCVSSSTGGEPLSTPKIRLKALDTGSWDLVVTAPHYMETSSPKQLRSDFLHALSICRLSENSRVVLCVPTASETNPVQLRAQVFGTSPGILMDVAEEVKGTLCEEDVFQCLESLGFATCFHQHLDCRVDISKFIKGAPGGIKLLSDWLRVSVDTCRHATHAEMNQLKKLAGNTEMEVNQPKTVFCLPIPTGFNHDLNAQPSREAWWIGDQTFRHHGLNHWNQFRANWSKPQSDGALRVPPVPKLSSKQMSGFADMMIAQRDKIELPCPMQLNDLIEVLVDVWESEE